MIDYQFTYRFGTGWRPALGPRHATMPEVAAKVADKHGLTLADLLGPSRVKRVAHARFEAMWLLYQQRRQDGSRRLSMPQIGRFFGGRDHTTVINAIRRHEEMLNLSFADDARRAVA